MRGSTKDKILNFVVVLIVLGVIVLMYVLDRVRFNIW
jgi:hypothetical protein